MSDIEHQEFEIKKLLNEMSSTYREIQLHEDASSSNPDNYDLINIISILEESFSSIGERLYYIIIAYFEMKNLTSYLSKFDKEIEPFLKSPKEMLKGEYSEYTGEVHSTLLSLYWKYLNSFNFLSDINNTELLKRTGIIYLESIIESTAVILNDLNVSPTSETQVSNPIKLIIKSVFPNASFPNESFQKTAICYKPDMLIPSLNCAIEYKYAETEKKLIETIDQILIDVKGYDNNQTYKIFFAVFYVKNNIWSKKRFDAVWEEKEFPNNWKGFFINGK